MGLFSFLFGSGEPDDELDAPAELDEVPAGFVIDPETGLLVAEEEYYDESNSDGFY